MSQRKIKREMNDAIRLADIKIRLYGVTGKKWMYKPKHEMFVGTAHALDIYHDHLILGREMNERITYQDETGSGYKLTEQSKRQMARLKALGEFLENCREDIEFLLNLANREREVSK